MGSFFEKEQSRKEAEAPAVEGQASAGPAAGQGAAAEVVRLQRQIGNQAVSRMLRPEQGKEDAPAGDSRPLPAAVRSMFEERFGEDFSGVRIHTSTGAAESARALDAAAYTVGRDVVFDAGKYNPHSRQGQHLLAHELTHVVQQSRGGEAPASFNAQSGLEREAATAAAEFSGGAAEVTVSGASSAGVARQENGGSSSSPGPSRGPTVTPQIKQALVEKLHEVRMETPIDTKLTRTLPDGTKVREPVVLDPKSAEAIPFHGARTVAVAAIIKPDGTVTYHSAQFDAGMKDHAEPQLLEKIKNMVEPGDTVALAVDQVPCTGKANCSAVIREFMADPRHGSLRTYSLRAVRRDAPAGTTVESAELEELTSGKTALQRDVGERGLREVPGLRRVRLPLVREPGAGPGTPTPTPPAAQQSISPTPGPSLPAGEPQAVMAARPAGRVMVALPKALGRGIRDMVSGMVSPKNLALVALEMANRSSMAKEESERAMNLIGARVNSPDLQRDISELIEKQRLEIARRQHRGENVYVTISMTLSFTNDVLNQLSLSRLEVANADESSISRTVMSHDLLQNENSMWWVKVSLPLGVVEVSRSEAIQFRLEELEELGNVPASMDLESAARLSDERNRLLEEQPKARQEEERAKAEEVRKPRVLADPGKRAEQQRELVERANQRAAQHPAPSPAPAAGPQSLTFEPPAPPMQFLPFAPPASATLDPSQVAGIFDREGQRIVALGTGLVDRGPDASPLNSGRVTHFLNEEIAWRENMKIMMNKYTDQGNSEAVRLLRDLLLDPAKPGPKLDRMRAQLE